MICWVIDMVNKTKILSELSKMAVDAMSTFSGMKKEVDTIVRLKIDKTINKMKLVKRDEFEILKKMVQKLVIAKDKLKKTNNKSTKLTRKKYNRSSKRS